MDNCKPQSSKMAFLELLQFSLKADSFMCKDSGPWSFYHYGIG